MSIKEKDVIDLLRNGGEKEVIKHLYKTVFPRVKSSIRKNNGNVEDAADVFQEAISYFYKSVVSGEFNEVYKPYGFIYSMSINRWLNQLRKTNKTTLIEDYDAYNLTNEEVQKNLKVSDEKKDLLERFFSDIGKSCLEILNLSIFKNITNEDIAHRLNLANANAAKMKIYRCRQRLIAKVNEDLKLKYRLQELI